MLHHWAWGICNYLRDGNPFEHVLNSGISKLKRVATLSIGRSRCGLHCIMSFEAFSSHKCPAVPVRVGWSRACICTWWYMIMMVKKMALIWMQSSGNDSEQSSVCSAIFSCTGNSLLASAWQTHLQGPRIFWKYSYFQQAEVIDFPLNSSKRDINWWSENWSGKAHFAYYYSLL